MPVSLTRVVAAVIERGNRVLVAQRAAEKRHGGMWEFPGGKVESAETDLDALRRELAEELGLRVISASPAVAAFRDPGSRFLIVFVPVVAAGEPECREHVAIRWVAWGELAGLPLAPTDHRFVAARNTPRLGERGCSASGR
jgi:8-oxo-dGTP diphosphatase